MSHKFKRKYPRADLSARVIIHNDDDLAYLESGTIGEGGLALNCKDKIWEPGTHVKLNVKSRHLSKAFVAEGEILNFLDKPEKNVCIKFTKISDKDRLIIREYVSKVFNERKSWGFSPSEEYEEKTFTPTNSLTKVHPLKMPGIEVPELKEIDEVIEAADADEELEAIAQMPGIEVPEFTIVEDEEPETQAPKSVMPNIEIPEEDTVVNHNAETKVDYEIDDVDDFYSVIDELDEVEKKSIKQVKPDITPQKQVDKKEAERKPVCCLLSKIPLEGSFEVYVDGKFCPEDSQNGWVFDHELGVIKFVGSYALKNGSKVSFNCKYVA